MKKLLLFIIFGSSLIWAQSPLPIQPGQNAVRVYCVGSTCGGAGGTLDMNLKQVGGTNVSAANTVDAVNTAFRVNCVIGCAGAADTVGTTQALNAGGATATVALAGDGGVGVFIAAGTLSATVVPELSYDGGTTYVASLFYDPAARTTSSSVVLTNPNVAMTLSILGAGGASHARVRVSSFTGGAANATLRATTNAGSLVVNQGNAPWADNVSQWGGAVLGAMANYGTSPGAVLVPGVNAFVTSLPAVTGTVTANQGGNWSTRTQDGAGTNITSNSTTTTSTQGLDINIRSILNTAPSAAGKLDVKGADGDVFVRQATGSNLHAVLDTGSTTAVTQATGSNLHSVTDSGSVTAATLSAETTKVIGTVNVSSGQSIAVTQATGTNLHSVTDSGSVTAATLNAETTKVIGTVRALGNAGAAFDAATAAAVPANALYVGGNGSGNLTGFIVCDKSVILNGFSTINSTQEVAASGSTKIYVCGFYVNGASTTTTTVKLVYGTGTNCATSPADFSIAVPIQAPTSVAPVGSNIAYGTNIVKATPASQALCVNLSASQAVNIEISYTQF